MIVGVADTHTALWYLLKNPRLSATARIFMDDAANAGHDIALWAISLAEIVYLVEKNRLPDPFSESIEWGVTRKSTFMLTVVRALFCGPSVKAYC